MDYEGNNQPNAQKLPTEYIRMVPVFESVSAGFGIGAENRILEFIPLFIQSDSEYEHTICVRVCGDSMHPQIQDGDLVQVLKQETAESGDIVVILDGNDAYVKRFIRSSNGITLESFNTNYPPMKFSREESNRLHIVGIVRRIIRDL
jgi:repressor LexA